MVKNLLIMVRHKKHGFDGSEAPLKRTIPTPEFLLENLMTEGARQAKVHCVTKRWDTI